MAKPSGIRSRDLKHSFFRVQANQASQEGRRLTLGHPCRWDRAVAMQRIHNSLVGDCLCAITLLE
jgi:hypothetical protein